MRVITLILVAVALAGCGKLPWAKKSFPYGKEERKLFADRDLYPIDGKFYLKVRERDTGQVRFVEVTEYLRSPYRWEVIPREGGQQGELATAEELRRTAPAPRKRPLIASLPRSPNYLKRKVLLLPIRAGDSPSPTLTDGFLRIFSQRALLCLPLGPQAMEAGKVGGVMPTEEEVRSLGLYTGAQAVLWAGVYGPYEVSGTGYCQMELKLFETLEGTEILALFLQETGATPQDALHLVMAKAVERTEEVLGRLGWFTRMAKVEGDKAYVLAGGLSGLKEGDLLVVKEDPKGEPLARLRVVELLGFDTAVAAGPVGDLRVERAIVLYREYGPLAEGS